MRSEHFITLQIDLKVGYPSSRIVSQLPIELTIAYIDFILTTRTTTSFNQLVKRLCGRGDIDLNRF